jgi:hypothetical protein
VYVVLVIILDILDDIWVVGLTWLQLQTELQKKYGIRMGLPAAKRAYPIDGTRDAILAFSQDPIVSYLAEFQHSSMLSARFQAKNRMQTHFFDETASDIPPEEAINTIRVHWCTERTEEVPLFAGGSWKHPKRAASLVTLNQMQLSNFLDYAKAHPNICWLDHLPAKKIQNLNSQWLTQSQVENYRPITAIRNLTGENQVIALGDTGVDWDHCFFRESDGAAPPEDEADLSRRKIVMYTPICSNSTSCGDNRDYVRGHGTHVAGTILGNPDGSAGRDDALPYRGIAPGAKLMVLDLSSGDDGVLQGIPENLYDDYYDVAYSNGAFIMMSGWTCYQEDQTLCNVYDENASDTDYFMYDYPDFVVAVPVGNSGDQGIKTVSSPSTSKNALAVGAAESSFSSFQHICDLNPGCDQPLAGQNQSNLAWFSAQGPTVPNGRIKPDVLATGIYVISANSDGDTTTNLCNGNVCQIGCCNYGFDSKTGEFVCIAQCPCTNSDALLISEGTSMATAAATGALALTREYLTQGFYPSGKATVADAMDYPRASTMKGLIIHSAIPLSGNYAIYSKGTFVKDAPLPPVPNMLQGHGSIQLDNTLYFEDSPFTLYLHEYDGETGDTFEICLKVNNASLPLAATLAWTDYPANPISYKVNGGNTLQNDIDLWMSDPSGTLYWGNGGVNADSVNNVEKIVIANPDLGYWKIGLIYKDIPYNEFSSVFGQLGSLIATGKFSIEAASDCSVCPGDCRGLGSCSSGKCQCQLDFGSPDCDASPVDILNNVESAESIIKEKYRLFRLNPAKYTNSYTLSYTVESASWYYANATGITAYISRNQSIPTDITPQTVSASGIGKVSGLLRGIGGAYMTVSVNDTGLDKNFEGSIFNVLVTLTAIDELPSASASGEISGSSSVEQGDVEVYSFPIQKDSSFAGSDITISVITSSSSQYVALYASIDDPNPVDDPKYQQGSGTILLTSLTLSIPYNDVATGERIYFAVEGKTDSTYTYDVNSPTIASSSDTSTDDSSGFLISLPHLPRPAVPIPSIALPDLPLLPGFAALIDALLVFFSPLVLLVFLGVFLVLMALCTLVTVGSLGITLVVVKRLVDRHKDKAVKFTLESSMGEITNEYENELCLMDDDFRNYHN